MSIHEPVLFASRYGCWSCCLCGWTSGGRWHRTVGAHLAFGRHLLDVAEKSPIPEDHPLALEATA